jgi:hypothetical protein
LAKACDSENSPDIYTSVGNSFCFIEIMTQCVKSREFFHESYDVCKDWLMDERENLRNRMQEAKEKVEGITGNSLRRRSAEKNLEKVQMSMKLFQKIDDELCGK